MRQYSNNEYNRSGMTNPELDPCIAAESRMKKSVLSSKTKRFLILLGILLLLLLVLGLLAFVLTAGNDSVDYEEHAPAARFNDDYDDYVGLKEDEESGLFGKQHPVTSEPPIIRDTTKTPLILHPMVEEKPMSTKRPIVIRIPVETTTEVPQTVPTKATTTTTYQAPVVVTTTTSTTTTPSPTTRRTTRLPTTSRKPTANNYNYYQPIESATPLTEEVKRDCLEHRESGLGSGVYHISPDGGQVFDVYCDMETDGGGWTVMQRRVNGKLAFYNRTYKEYEAGFGKLTSSHWLGLSSVEKLTSLGGATVTLRIELRGDTCDSCSHQPNGYWWGEWDFALGDANSLYQLSISPAQIRGNLSMPTKNGRGRWETMSNGRPFTAIDKDNDSHSVNCAQFRNYGGWWHRDCTLMALNGVYGDNRNKLRYLVYLYETPHEEGKPAASYHVHPKQTIMMLRPKH